MPESIINICQNRTYLNKFFAGAKVAIPILKSIIMDLQDDSKLPQYSEEEETASPEIVEKNETAETEDTDPPLDEEDLEENNLTVEEADQIIWDEPEKGSAGDEEKDITD